MAAVYAYVLRVVDAAIQHLFYTVLEIVSLVRVIRIVSTNSISAIGMTTIHYTTIILSILHTLETLIDSVMMMMEVALVVEAVVSDTHHP